MPFPPHADSTRLNFSASRAARCHMPGRMWWRRADGRSRCHQAGRTATSERRADRLWQGEEKEGEKTHTIGKIAAGVGLPRGELIDTAGLSAAVFWRRVRWPRSPRGCRCLATSVLLGPTTTPSHHPPHPLLVVPPPQLHPDVSPYKVLTLTALLRKVFYNKCR